MSTTSVMIDRLASSKALFDTTTALLATLAICLAFYHYWKMCNFFRKQGLKAPTPLPLLGNLYPLLTTDRMKLEQEYSKKYGRMYGVFHGTKPLYVVNDAEVIRQICIKDFAYMPDHEVHSLMNQYQKDFIIFTKGDKWRRLRAMQSNTFTSGKIKRMFKLLDRCADDLVRNFAEQLDDGHTSRSEAIVNVKDIYSLYTMDAIATAAYSIKLDRKINTTNKRAASTRGEFVSLAMRIFEVNTIRLIIGFTVWRRLLNAIGFYVSPLHYYTDLEDRLGPIVEQRRKSAKKADDYLQILVDARIDDAIELDEIDEKENHHADLTPEGLQADQKKMLSEIEKSNGVEANSPRLEMKSEMTDPEIISSAIFLLVVGIETTATLLTNCSYALAYHSDIQQRLYETLKSIAEFNQETGEYSFDYATLTSCEYLDAVVSETLRNLSPVINLDRVVSQDYYVEKYGVQLRRGDKLNLAFYSIMNDPEYWPNPLKFDPERFMGENKRKIVPGSYCPFGLGPRHCLGMRFSLTEAKLALAKVLMKFQFKPAPKTSFPPESKRNLGLNNLKRPEVIITAR